MAEELQRVGLVFKADGSVDFKKSLKEVNASIQENRSAFKLAQAQWDKNTKSADKLKDRQKYLKQQTQDYSDKVKLLERELRELEESEDRNETAIEKKKTALNNAKTTLKHYENGLKEVDETLRKGTHTIEEYAQKLERIGTKMQDVGRTLSTHVTAPIMALGGLAIKSAMELDEGYDIIIAKTGATGDALQGLTDVADNVFNSLPYEMSDVGTAVGEINTRFGVTGKELERLTRKFLKYADVNDADVNESIRLVARAMGDAGIPMEQTGEILDKLTVAGQASGIEIGKLAENMAKYGAPMRALGFDTDATIAIFAGWEKAGVNTEIAFSGMKQAIGRWSKEGKDAREEFGLTLQKIQEAPSISEATALAIEAFGQKAGPDLADAIQNGRFEYEDFLQVIGGSAGVLESTWEAQQDPWDKMKTAVNNLKSAGEDLGGSIADVLTPQIETLCNKIKELSEWFGKLSEKQQTWAVKIGEIVAVVGPVLIFVGAIVKAVSTIGGAIGSLLGFLGSVGGAVIVVIGAIAGVGYAIYHDWENIVESCKQFVSDFKDMIEQDKDKIVGVWEKLKTGVTNLKDKFVAVWNTIKEKVGNAVDNIKEKMDTGIQTAKDAVSSKLDAIKQKFSSIFETCKTTVKNAIDKIKGFFDFDWSLPKLKLPHPKISGEFSLNPPKVPSFSVDWYKKAVGKAFLMQRPTAFAVDGSTVRAGGEAGAEFLVGERHLRNMILSASQNNNADVVEAIQNMENHLMELFMQFFPEFILGNVTIGERQLKRVLTEMGVKFA